MSSGTYKTLAWVLLAFLILQQCAEFGKPATDMGVSSVTYNLAYHIGKSLVPLSLLGVVIWLFRKAKKSKHEEQDKSE